MFISCDADLCSLFHEAHDFEGRGGGGVSIDGQGRRAVVDGIHNQAIETKTAAIVLHL